jgi:signal transduction histidine kinase
MRTFIYLTLCLLVGHAGLGQSPPPEEKQVRALLKMPVSRDRDTALAYLYDRCARHWIFQGLLQRADEPLSRFDVITKTYIWPYGEALLLYRKGHYETLLGNATKAKNYFLQAIPRLRQTGQTSTLLAAYTQMASSEIDRDHSDTTGIQTAIGYLQEGRALSLKTPKRLFYSALCYHLGRAYLQLHNYPQARYYLNESWGESKRNGYTEMPFYHCLLFSVCYLHLGDSMHRQTWQQCQSFLPNLNNQEYYDYYSVSADRNRFLGNYERILTDGKKIVFYAKALHSPTKVLQSHRILFDAYKLLHQSEAALHELETIKQLEDSTLRQRSNVLLAELQLKYNTKQQQEEFGRQTIENQRTQTRFLTGGILLLLLLLGIIIYNNRQIRQKNRAIVSAQLKGQTLERHRVAADLHDNLGSTLSSLNFSLSAIDTSKLSQPEQLVYSTVAQQLSQAYTDLRLLAHNLLPRDFDKLGLLAAIRLLAERVNQQKSVQVSLDLPNDAVRFDLRIEFELYSICSELVNNILKHASATRAMIAIHLVDDGLQLLVGDNGTGLGGQGKDGRGLKNIAARVDALGGTWEIHSAPGNGVQHEIMVPAKKRMLVA